LGRWHDFINAVLDDEYGLLAIARPPLNIIDLAANIGIFSLWARHCFPEAVIHCYEPNPDLWSFSKANLEGLDVDAYPTAVASQTGMASLVAYHDSRCSQVKLDKFGEVNLESIKTVLERAGQPVDLLKIDIEGGEWDLLLNDDDRLLQSVGRVVLEYHETDDHGLSSLTEAATRHGFRVERIFRNDRFGIAWLQKKN
jgi:FkbM family methyltransferase